MIVALSTSSPISSVAVLSEAGQVLGERRRLAPRAAGGACLEMLDELLAELSAGLADATLFVADVGPGSFTGVKVGVTLAKVLAFERGVRAAGVSSFDLVDPGAVVAVPCRRGEYLVRVPGSAPERAKGAPPAGSIGYGEGFARPDHPLASRVTRVLARLVAVAPQELVPEYVLEPSISKPARAFGALGA